MSLVWEALGCGLAHYKGRSPSTVVSIGGTLTCESTGIRPSVKESILADICDDLRRVSRRNITTKKEFHSLVGKLGHAARLLIIMHPFPEPLWAALYSKGHGGSGRCPRNTHGLGRFPLRLTGSLRSSWAKPSLEDSSSWRRTSGRAPSWKLARTHPVGDGRLAHYRWPVRPPFRMPDF